MVFVTITSTVSDIETCTLEFVKHRGVDKFTRICDIKYIYYLMTTTRQTEIYMLGFFVQFLNQPRIIDQIPNLIQNNPIYVRISHFYKHVY